MLFIVAEVLRQIKESVKRLLCCEWTNPE